MSNLLKFNWNKVLNTYVLFIISVNNYLDTLVFIFYFTYSICRYLSYSNQKYSIDFSSSI